MGLARDCTLGKSQLARFSYFLKRMLCRLPKRSYHVIDPRIIPLVERMNQTGLFRTLASCQGHGGLFRPPYVYFKALAEDAALLERTLRRTLEQASSLQEAWVVEGRFDHELNLTFILYSPAHHRRSSSLLSTVRFSLFRSGIDSDLSRLAQLVEECAWLKARDNEPQNAASNDDDRQTE